MPFTQVNDITVYYEQHGAGTENLVLIGGLGADHNVWKSIIRMLSPYFRIVIFDARGSGQSTTTEQPYTTELMASDVVALMDALKIDKAHMIGHSMGGCVAQQIAIKFPSRLNRLVLACSRAEPSVIANQIMAMRCKLADQGLDSHLLTEYTLPFLFSQQFLKSDITVKGFIQWSIQNPFPQSLLGFKNQLNAVKMHNIMSYLSDFNAPTLVMAGEDDLLMPAKNAKAFAQLIPNGTYHEVKGSAHMPHVEHPKEFAQVALHFLTQ